MPETTIFDHYEVLRRDDGSLFELGRGSMGITYKGVDRNLRTPVALKVINAGSIHSEVARQRFVREARAAALLRHRNVASVFHLGTQDDTYFYAMEFIEGETVESVVRRRGPLPPVLAFRLAVQVARALNAAQRHALIHRDIKPSNLMLVREDEELVVKVIDFGLAKSSLTNEDNPNDVTLSAAGFVGTPHFSSPEQLEERDLDIRSDIYSLGVTLWYMLTGEAPFQGALAQVMSQHLHDPPPVERIAFLPETVRQVLLEFLAKNRAERPQNGAEARAKLETSVGILAEGQPLDHSLDVDILPESGKRLQSSPRTRGFRTSAIIAGRYELMQDLGESNGGWAYEAEDLRDGTRVRLVVIQAEWESDSAALRQLEQEIAKLNALNQVNLLRALSVERSGEASFLLFEWTTGFSLLELLRVRQSIDADEAVLLLRQLAAGVDEAAGHGLRHLDFSLSQILVHFAAAEAEPDRQLATPLDRWPDFQAKINALGITREFASSIGWVGGRTVIGSLDVGPFSGSGSPLRHYVQSLAAVVYELLGGSLSPLMLGGLGTQPLLRYKPLATLPEAANAVMKRALENAEPFASAEEFRAELEAALATGARAAAMPVQAAGASGAKAQPSMPHGPQRVRSSILENLPRIPWLAIGAVAALLLAVAGLWLMNRPSQPPVVAALAAASPTLIPSTPAPTAPIATPIPPPAATAAPDVHAQMRAAIQQAEDYEAAENWPQAIDAYINFTRQYPGVETGRLRLESLLAHIAPALDKMSPDQFAALQPGILAAASQDVVAAMAVLGSQLKARAPQDAFAWYCAAAARGDADAMTQAGLMVSNGTGAPLDFVQAAQWFQMAANAGDAAGETCLGECYLHGTGVKRDDRHALTLLQDAAAAGDPRGMNLLGNCYHDGIGGPKDYAAAFQLFSQAHTLGFPDATANLGVLYMNGDGVPRDAHKGVNLFAEGAQEGSAYSMYLLARCLEHGDGIRANPFQAEGWYRKAAAGGNPMAIAWCNSRHLTIEQPPQ